jgi:hypothetical protein
MSLKNTIEPFLSPSCTFFPKEHHNNAFSYSSALGKGTAVDGMIPLTNTMVVLDVAPSNRLLVFLEVFNGNRNSSGPSWHDVKRIVAKIFVLLGWEMT